MSKNLIASFLHLSGFLNALLCHRIALTHGLAFFLSHDDPHASDSVIIFVRQNLSFSELSTSSFSLDPYSDYVRVNVSLKNSSPFSKTSTLLLFTLLGLIVELTLCPLFTPFLDKSLQSGGLDLSLSFLRLKRYFRPSGRSIQWCHLLRYPFFQ